MIVKVYNSGHSGYRPSPDSDYVTIRFNDIKC